MEAISEGKMCRREERVSEFVRMPPYIKRICAKTGTMNREHEYGSLFLYVIMTLACESALGPLGTLLSSGRNTLAFERMEKSSTTWMSLVLSVESSLGSVLSLRLIRLLLWYVTILLLSCPFLTFLNPLRSRLGVSL